MAGEGGPEGRPSAVEPREDDGASADEGGAFASLEEALVATLALVDDPPGDPLASPEPLAEARAPHPFLDLFDAEAVARALRLFAPLTRYHRLDVRGLSNIPRGAALLVSNHNGGLSPVDGLFLVPYYRTRGIDERVYVLAHDVLFKIDAVGRFLARYGVVPASHHHGDEVLRRGHRLLVFPGGDLESMRPYGERQRMSFRGRTGFARLALRMGVPIVPIVSAGAHETFVVLSQGRGLARVLARLGLGGLRIKTIPVAFALPWGLVAGPTMALPYLPLPSRITVQIEPPIDPAPFAALPEEEGARALADRVEAEMKRRLEALYAERRGVHQR